MPAYDYLCNACGRQFETRQKMSDPEIESCPECGGALKRLIGGGAGVISKGGSQSAQPASHCGTGAPCGMQGGCPNQQFCHPN